MNNTDKPDTLTVLYDGGCPLCRREIAHVKGLSERQADSSLCFVDISDASQTNEAYVNDRATLLARFHIERADGSRVDGAAAFVAMWERLPGWRWLAKVAKAPGVLWLLERMYRLFLKIRPSLQAAARRLEARQHNAGKRIE